MQEIWIPASLGRLYGVLQVPEGAPGLIILSHGFNGCHLGNQDFADYFSAHGFATFCLDFCGGGAGSKSDGKLQDMSVLTEAEDLNCVIDYFLPDFPDIFLWGASQGGFVSSYAAAQRPDDIRGLVLEFPAYVLQDDAKKRADPDGNFPETIHVMNAVIGRKYHKDAVSFDIYDVIGKYTGPVLLEHGDLDEIVPLRYSERARDRFRSCEFVVVKGQGHGFRNEEREKAMARELAFFRRECH